MSEQIRTIFLGNLGEYLVAWLLRSKYGIQTSIVKGKGIDILCVDKESKVFPKNEHIAISVKTRARNKENERDPVTLNWDEIKEGAKSWNALPYIAYVRICSEKGYIEVFLVEVSEAEKWGKQFNVPKAAPNLLFKMDFTPYSFLSDW
jgi:hypothetical protein